ncbi:MAG: phosphatidate cytidylyltransferase, partial [Bacteroidota bacterium]
MLNILYLALAFLALFASAEWLYHKRGVKAEVTRKYVHIATGLLTMLFPLMLENHWLVLLLCGSFLLILIASLRFNLLPSINAVDRKTSGSLMYPIIVYGCYLVYSRYDQFMFYYIPILILALCDPIAAFVGMNYPVGKYQTFGKTKTWSG